MHQQSRHPPRVSSPASSPQTNPTRTNNPRDRVRAESETAGTDDKSESTESYGSMPSRDSIKKLDQIIQNFYAKAAVVIVQSRINTTPVGGRRAAEVKPNLWFSLETDEIEDFRDELRVYKQSGSFENRPPPMIIETYIDASRLSSKQSLVVLDEHGKRWDVLEALNLSETSDDSPRQRHARKRNTEVILERWRLELKCPSEVVADEFGPTLPTVYKRSIVFFRSLFIMSRLMPGWKNFPSAVSKGIHPTLEVKCRILSAETEYTTYDPLRQPLHDGKDPVSEYVFSDLEVPVGRFYASVTYRNDFNFRVDDAESLLSSQFMGVDDNYFRPSLPQRKAHGRSDSYAEPGSLPSHRQDRGPQGPQQTYGSLSTFHGAGALGTSPITALRSVRPVGSDTSSPSGSISGSVEQPDPPHSLPIRGTAARPMSRPYDGSGRRPSVSFQPFKAGSLSGSPRIPDLEAPSSPQSLNRPGLAGPSRTGNRSSLTMGSAASLRGGPPAPQEVPSTSGSPRPSGRYSSSFTHRRNRPSFGGQSKADEDQASSGKQSLSSSVQPGSGLLTEAGAVTSSGSFADDDNISEFLKALDSRKTLKSFEPNKKGESLASKRTAAQLSKFQQMRETNNVLTESMTSSIHLQRSSSSSSRQLTNVPSMVNPASMSISSSPGKPLSPHTPHTPAIPSRLSENSIIDYQPQNQPRQRQGRNNPDTSTPGEESEPVEEDDDDDETPMVTQQDSSNSRANRSSDTTTTTTTTGTTAIDIPLSPRLLHHGGGGTGGLSSAAIRRPSSLAHQQQQQHQQQPPPQGHRSIAAEVEAASSADVPTLSALLAYQQLEGGGGAAASGSESESVPPAGPSSVDADRVGDGGAPLGPAGGGERGERGSGGGGGGGGGISAGLGMGLGLGLGRAAGSGSLGGGSGNGGRAARYRPASASAASPSPSGSGSGMGIGVGIGIGIGPGLGAGIGSGRGGRLGSFSSGASAGGVGGVGQRYAGSVEGADEEPLLFAMSELERDSRRSLDEGGGGGGSGQGRAGGGGGGGKYDTPRGIQRKGW